MTVDREAVIAYLREHPETSNAAACRLFPGTNKDTVAKWRWEAGIPNPHAKKAGSRAITPPEPEQDETPVLPADIPPIPQEMIEKSGAWKSIQWLQREIERRDPRVEEARVELPGNLPVMIAFLSDTHIGALNCDMARLWDDLERAGRTPGFYLIAGGDLMENVVSSVSNRGSFYEQLVPPGVQLQLVEEMADLVPRDRWLAVCIGNHEAWSIRDSDHDPMRYFAEHVNTTYFGPWGFLHVRLGSVTYTILAGHKFSGNSKINKTGMVKRAMDRLGDADIVFAGHVHEYAVEVTEVRRRSRVFAVAGTYLKTSRYGQSLGNSTTSAMMPGAVFFPNERKLVFTEDAFGDGIHLLASFRPDVVCECKHCSGARKDAA
jgi:hypothetical protein